MAPGSTYSGKCAVGPQVQANPSTRLNSLDIPGQTAKSGTGNHKRDPASSWAQPDISHEGVTEANKGGRGTPVSP